MLSPPLATFWYFVRFAVVALYLGVTYVVPLGMSDQMDRWGHDRSSISLSQLGDRSNARGSCKELFAYDNMTLFGERQKETFVLLEALQTYSRPSRIQPRGLSYLANARGGRDALLSC